MPIRFYSKSSQRLVDGLICAAAWAAAYQIRFEGQVPADVVRQMLLLLLPLAAGQVSVSTLLGIYRFQWRYISSEDALYIARAYLGFFAVPLAIHFMLGDSAGLFNVPGSIAAIAFVLSLMGALAARLARRLVYRRTSQPCVDGRPRRYLLVGAGRHGAMVAEPRAGRRAQERLDRVLVGRRAEEKAQGEEERRSREREKNLFSFSPPLPVLFLSL